MNIEKYLDNDINNPKYLFHGSPNLYNELEPQQSHCDSGNEKNIDKAVFMYPLFYKSVPYALKGGFIKKEEYGIDSWFETSNRTIEYPYAIVNNREIDMDAFGYIYVFEKNDDMKKDDDSYQYRCHHSLIPIDIIKVSMKDYLDLLEIRNNDIKKHSI